MGHWQLFVTMCNNFLDDCQFYGIDKMVNYWHLKKINKERCEEELEEEMKDLNIDREYL